MNTPSHAYPPIAETVTNLAKKCRYTKREICEAVCREKTEAEFNTCYMFLDGSFLIIPNSEV